MSAVKRVVTENHPPLCMPFYTAAGYKKLVYPEEPASRPKDVILKSIVDKLNVLKVPSDIMAQALKVVDEVHLKSIRQE